MVAASTQDQIGNIIQVVRLEVVHYLMLGLGNHLGAEFFDGATENRAVRVMYPGI